MKYRILCIEYKNGNKRYYPQKRINYFKWDNIYYNDYSDNREEALEVIDLDFERVKSRTEVKRTIEIIFK